MQNIITYMPVLGVAMVVNILLGLYYKIGVEELKFETKVFINGVIKAIIIALSFFGIAYCFTKTDLSQIGISPETIMLSAIALYVCKALTNLASILGVETKK